MSKFYSNYLKKHSDGLYGVCLKEKRDAEYKQALIRGAKDGRAHSNKQGSKTLERLLINSK